jgi:hypothetical protein
MIYSKFNGPTDKKNATQVIDKNQQNHKIEMKP